MPQSNDAGTVAPETTTTATTTTDHHEAAEPAATASPGQQQQQEQRAEGLRSFLDIPDEAWAQIQKPEGRDLSGTQESRDESVAGTEGANVQHSTLNAQRPTEEVAEEAADTAAATEEGEDTTVDQDQDQDADVRDDDPKAVKKLKKRVGRLTRRATTAERLAEQLAAENDQYRSHFEQSQQQNGEAANAAPGVAGVLGNVNTEGQLNQLISQAQSMLPYCDKLLKENPAGVEIGEGDKKRFVTPEEVQDWRRNAEYVLLNAPIRQRQIERFSQARSQYVQLARRDYPENFDEAGNWRRDSKAAVVAGALLREFPQLAGHPARDFALSVMIEGYKAREARLKANGGGRAAASTAAVSARNDLDPRVLGTPRVPLAPHTPKANGRTGAPSQAKRVTEAKQELIGDTDGGRDSLVKLFAARDAAKPAQARNGSAAVAV